MLKKVRLILLWVAGGILVILMVALTEQQYHVAHRLFWDSSVKSEWGVGAFNENIPDIPPPPRPGNGRIEICLPGPQPRIFMLDRDRTYRDGYLALADLPRLPTDPVIVGGRLNAEGRLDSTRVVQSCHDDDVDAIILSRISQWRYTQYATGPIRIMVAPAAKDVLIIMTSPSLAVYAEHIAEPKYLVACTNEFNVNWVLR